ncbi:hypothetical protein L6303_01455, partial [archaeon]|nr:hypothetical protein [Nanoarchaeota archaeon]MCG2723384.1 hypothetical protein [archaeon]
YAPEKIDNFQRMENGQELINSYDLLFIVEHPKYNEIYNQLKQAGAIIASGSSIEISLDSKSILISIDPNRIKDMDLAWPANLSYRTEEEINFQYFNIAELPAYPEPLEQIEPTKIIITDFHPDTKFKQDWELEEVNFSYSVFLRNVVKSIIGTSKRNVWLSRYSAELAGVVDQYISGFLFGRQIDFEDKSNVMRLRNQQLFDFVVTEVRRQIMKFIENIKSNDVVEAQWAKLSNFKEMKVRMERSITTKKCLYPFIDFPYKGGFERQFTEDQLDNDSMVDSYVKLNQYLHGFSITYLNSRGYPVPYYPDFIVKTKEFMLIVETKSEKDAQNDIDVKSKAIAAEQKCREFSKIKTTPPEPIIQPKQWKYILLPQDIYKEMEGQSLRAIISKCESNLALIKMKREN